VRDNILLTWMHTRLMAEFVLRLPLLDGCCALGRPLRHRRAAQRRADQGSQLFERSEFCETPTVVSSAGKPRSGR
jgi:hypothetical protein